MTVRYMKDDEYAYVRHLLMRAGEDRWLVHLKDLRVQPMRDGGMGSLRFYSSNPDRRRVERVAVDEFKDSDGIPVSVEITIDQYGDLFELDSFKADFTSLHAWPTISDS